MSLKAFHIVFIIFSTLLALGTAAWCVWVDLVEGAPIYLAVRSRRLQLPSR